MNSLDKKEGEFPGSDLQLALHKHSCAEDSPSIDTMKTAVAVMFAVSSLFLAGCYTNHHVTKWEYMQRFGMQSDAELNRLADEGWSIVSYSGEGQPVYILKRPRH